MLTKKHAVRHSLENKDISTQRDVISVPHKTYFFFNAHKGAKHSTDKQGQGGGLFD